VAGGVSVNCVARWDGTSWSALGSGMSGVIPPRVFALAVLPNGDLVAGGYFTAAGGVSAENIARWNGTSWSALGSGTNSVVNALMVLPNGDLVAAGGFSLAGGSAVSRVARWDGASWSALGSGVTGQVHTVTALAGGDLVVGGSFVTGAFQNLARWNGAFWFPLSWGTSGVVRALATLPNGDLVAGGGFYFAGAVSSYLAQLTTTCPATAVSFGAGCTGSGGPNVLTASTLPWTGAVFRSVATGMPSNGLALSVLGFATLSIPLPAILPQGVPGCTLLVSPDLLELHIPVSGSVSTQLALPNSAALAGQLFHQQVVPVELGAGGITALTSTNALTLTIGSF
jgi:hypothetical protein